MFKQIIKGKSEWFCDVCGKEISPPDNYFFILTKKIFSHDKTIDLCAKHGKIIQNKIEELKVTQSD